MQKTLPEMIRQLKQKDHLCLIYENQKQQFETVIPFMQIGLEKKEKCFYIADDNTAGQVLEAMQNQGIDTDTYLKNQALVIASKKETYTRRGYFDPDLMIDFLTETTKQAKKEGFRGWERLVR